MDNLYYRFGKVLKTIRVNKGYTQEEIADGKMSRSNYTKVENDEINPNIVKFFTILDHMDMSEAEFSFILHGYKLTEKENVIYTFKKMSQDPTVSYVKHLITISENLLKKREDHFVRDILNLSLGYWSLLKEHDLERAQIHAGKVWDRLNTLDKFYLAELHLLNRMLYFFEIETAIALTNSALENLQQYCALQEANDLRLSYLSHISCILVDKGQYSRAMVYIEHLIVESKKDYAVISLGAAMVRKGMCLNAAGLINEGNRSFTSAADMFDLMDRKDYAVRTRKNPKTVYNPFGYVTL